jgi:hypothetical protein
MRVLKNAACIATALEFMRMNYMHLSGTPAWGMHVHAVAEDVEFGLAHGLLPFVSPPAYVARAPQTELNCLQTDWCALFRRHTFRAPIGVCA